MVLPRTRRRAFTLFEILVVLTIMAAMTAMAGGVFTGPTNYYRTRGSAESVLWDVRRIQEIARIRGFGVPGLAHGVKFYRGQWDFANNTASPIGWSYAVYGINGAPEPPDNLGSLSADQGRQLVPLAATIQVVPDAVTNRTDVPPGTRFQFDQQGLADAASPVSIDLYDAAVGWFRLRVVQRKFVGLEYSPL